MGSRLKVQPVSRVGLAPLVEMAEHLRAMLPGWEGTVPVDGQRNPSDLRRDLAHLAHYDADGFLIASHESSVLGFVPAYVRSRQLVLPQPWVLPEAREEGVTEILLRRALAFGERSGAADFAAHLLGGGADQSAAFRFGLRPRFPVYRLRLAAEPARQVGSELAKLLPGQELDPDELARRSGAADLERLDRLARGVSRPMDHDYWLTSRQLRLAKVKEGQRLAAYAYGGAGQCGPVVGTTREAALAALGWALQFAGETAGATWVDILVPAPFESALEQLLDANAACASVGQWMSRQPGPSFERVVLASPTLP
ncbi:MAG: hypothetical protein AB2L07_11685 [Thermoanaerobaculaceae bacterium]